MTHGPSRSSSRIMATKEDLCREVPQSTETSDAESAQTRISFSSSSSLATSPASSTTTTTTTSREEGLAPLNLDELLVERLGKAMEAIAKAGDAGVADSKGKDRSSFTCKSGSLPTISLRSYLKRMLKYIDNGNVSTSFAHLSAGMKALVSSIVFVDRVAADTGMIVNSFNIHRLIAAGMLVALKINEDAVVDMALFAALAGVQAKEMAMLEIALLEKLDWHTFISEAEFSARIASFERLTTKMSKASKRSTSQSPALVTDCLI